MRNRFWACLGGAIVILSIATSVSATVVTTSISFKPDPVVGAAAAADNFELSLSVVNPKVIESSGGVFDQDVKQAGLGNGTRFTWAEGPTGTTVANGATTKLKVKFEKVFTGMPITIDTLENPFWTEKNKMLNRVAFPGFREFQVARVGKDPLTELDILNSSASTLIVTDFSWAISNVEIPLATLDFDPLGLANFVGTLTVPSGGLSLVFQNVNINDDQFLVFQGKLSDTSTFAIEQNIQLPQPSSGWLLLLGLFLLAGRAIRKRRSEECVI